LSPYANPENLDILLVRRGVIHHALDKRLGGIEIEVKDVEQARHSS
jgi:hypothetical protein